MFGRINGLPLASITTVVDAPSVVTTHDTEIVKDNMADLLSYAEVENLLDKTYRPHLNGINRVAGSDVAIGARIPGDGLNGFVQVAWTF